MSSAEFSDDGERPVKIRKIETSSDVSAKDRGAALPAEFTESDTKQSQQNVPVETYAENDQNHVSTTDISDTKADQAPDADEVTPKLSKNQLKKLRKREQWEAGRADRKTIRKEKIKAKRERKREERQADEAAGISTDIKPRKAVQLPVTFVLDCSWDDLMMEKEVVSLGNQLTRCYSDNFKANFRAHLAVSSFGGRLRERFDTILERQYEGWKGFHFLEKDFVGTAQDAPAWMAPQAQRNRLQGQFSKFIGQEEALRNEGEIVYLSSDSEETLTELKPYSVYIIGGLVDKNRHKGICHKRAGEKGIRTAKLPIGDYMSMNSRYVLAVNHVNEIMLKWLELGDWGKAFEAVMPKRKGAVLKQTQVKASHGGDAVIDEDDEHEHESLTLHESAEVQKRSMSASEQVEPKDAPAG